MIILNTVRKTHKIIKDPIYGYINIPVEIFEVIDSPAFQRLRDIVQTSYNFYTRRLHKPVFPLFRGLLSWNIGNRDFKETQFSPKKPGKIKLLSDSTIIHLINTPDTEGENLFYIFAPTARKKRRNKNTFRKVN